MESVIEKERAAAPEVPAAAETISPGLQGRVLRLAWPVIGENLLQTMLGIVDTLLVARLSTAAIAGVGTGIQLTFFLISALAAVTIGASILVAHAAGAGDTHAANRLAKQALVWGGLISLPLAALSVVLAQPLVAIFGLTPDVAVIAEDYWRIVAGSSTLLILMLAAGAVLRGAGDSRTPMLATLLANVINAVAAYALIFGHFGLPALGASGSAWAASLGRLVGAALLIAVLLRGTRALSVRGGWGWRPDLGVARRVFSLGVPAAVEQVLTTLSFLTLTVIVASLGTEVLAAQRLTFNALSIAFLPGFGFAIAATALVGQSLGARRPAEAAASAGIATRWAMIWMGVLGVVYFFFGEQILLLFQPEPEVLAVGVDSMRVIAFSCPFWAIMMVQAGALRGVGNTGFPLRVNALGMWAAVGLAALAVGWLGFGLAGAWGAYVVVAPAMTVVLWRRFARRDWQTTQLTSDRPVVAATIE
jgi:putative MATE family efflux protein